MVSQLISNYKYSTKNRQPVTWTFQTIKDVQFFPLPLYYSKEHPNLVGKQCLDLDPIFNHHFAKKFNDIFQIGTETACYILLQNG